MILAMFDVKQLPRDVALLVNLLNFIGLIIV